MDFVSTISRFVKTKSFADSVDYFNYRFIPAFILSCSFLMTYKQYLTKPITCYTTNSSHGKGFDEYIQNQCYISEEYTTYNVTEALHWKTANPTMLTSNKYMWFPIILIMQAITFCIPNKFLLYFGKQPDCNYILDLCYKASIETYNKPSIHKIVKRIQNYFDKKKINFQIMCVYLLTKIITVSICCINYAFLWNSMFQNDWSYAFNVMKDMITSSPIK